MMAIQKKICIIDLLMFSAYNKAMKMVDIQVGVTYGVAINAYRLAEAQVIEKDIERTFPSGKKRRDGVIVKKTDDTEHLVTCADVRMSWQETLERRERRKEERDDEKKVEKDGRELATILGGRADYQRENWYRRRQGFEPVLRLWFPDDAHTELLAKHDITLKAPPHPAGEYCAEVAPTFVSLLLSLARGEADENELTALDLL